MKIQQTELEFKPITIVLESKEEAQVFATLIDIGYQNARCDSKEELVANDIKYGLEGVNIFPEV